MEWRQERDLAYLIGESTMKQKSFEQMGTIRSSVAGFFGCKPQNVALVSNFTLGLNIFL